MLLDEHRGAFEYDWRTRFGLGLDSLPASMDWGEAFRLTMVLAGDPSSQVCAALSGWKYPLAWSDIVFRDLYDLQHASKSKRKKPKPYPRPWDKEAKTHGQGTHLTPEQYRAIRARNMDN